MSFAPHIRIGVALAIAATVSIIALTTASLSIGTAPAAASTGEMTMIQDSDALASNPTRTLQIFRSLGVNIIRVPLQWNSVASDPNSRTTPANPYPDANWSAYDSLIGQAYQYGIKIDLMPTGPAPLWATATGAPSGFASVWKPSATAYGQFVRAAAMRYSGTYTPAGETAALPRVSFWELWNEGNWSPSLSPLVPSKNSKTYLSAMLDRSLIASAWTALQQTGHGHDTIVYGSLSPDQSATVVPASSTSISPPLAFLRTLYCLNSSYQPLRGSAAKAVGCPTSKSAFIAQNPALFQAAGIGVHPYGYGNPPTKAAFPNPNSVEFAEIPQLMTALNRIKSVYGAKKSLAIYNTEYGYEPRPPQTRKEFPTQAQAATFINEAEYLSFKNPRIATYDQYLLFNNPNDWFTTGLVSSSGKLMPSFYAFRMPIWLPVTSTKRGRALEVWGDVRPAHNASVDTGRAQSVQIQFARGSSGRFGVVKTVRIVNSRGYIDVNVKFPASGQVRLAWTYPSGDTKLTDPLQPRQRTIYSRVTSITLR